MNEDERPINPGKNLEDERPIKSGVINFDDIPVGGGAGASMGGFDGVNNFVVSGGAAPNKNK